MSAPSAPRPLRASHPRDWTIPLLLLLSGGLLVAGQVLPGVTIRSLGYPPDHYSVYGGVVDLWRGGNRLLAAVLFSFSIVFPTVKWFALVWLWYWPQDARRRAAAAHWLKPLGKWSMLDTFVVTALIGAVQLETPLVKLATAGAESAVYWFGASILLSILLSFRVARLADDETGEAHFTPRPDGALVLAPLAAAGCLVAALFQPILLVEKKLLEHTFSLPATLRRLAGDGEWFLVVVLALFVALLPLVYFVGLGCVAWLQARGRRVGAALSALVALERWAMVDVFFLGVLLVFFKVVGFAEATRLPGFWLLGATAALSLYCALRTRRVY